MTDKQTDGQTGLLWLLQHYAYMRRAVKIAAFADERLCVHEGVCVGVCVCV